MVWDWFYLGPGVSKLFNTKDGAEAIASAYVQADPACHLYFVNNTNNSCSNATSQRHPRYLHVEYKLTKSVKLGREILINYGSDYNLTPTPIIKWDNIMAFLRIATSINTEMRQESEPTVLLFEKLDKIRSALWRKLDPKEDWPEPTSGQAKQFISKWRLMLTPYWVVHCEAEDLTGDLARYYIQLARELKPNAELETDFKDLEEFLDRIFDKDNDDELQPVANKMAWEQGMWFTTANFFYLLPPWFRKVPSIDIY
jgi:hypothetical protein